jgi:adenine phosphoribosyltransferase
MPAMPDPYGSVGAPVSDPLGRVIAARLRDVPDFPEPGILFKDISPLLADAVAMRAVVLALAEQGRAFGGVDLVAGVEARGFFFAAAVGYELRCGVVAVRKAGKLPPPTVHAEYQLEYGTAAIEVPVGVLDDQRVLLVDDVLATGGTVSAAADLLEKAGAEVAGIGVVVELAFLGGRARLAPRPLDALLTVGEPPTGA